MIDQWFIIHRHTGVGRNGVILIISTPYDLTCFKRLLGDGSDYDVHLEYTEQPSPYVLAQAFIIGEFFIGNDGTCLVLEDNFFYDSWFTKLSKMQ